MEITSYFREYDRGGNEKAAGQQGPIDCKLVDKRGKGRVNSWSNGTAGRLDSLVKACKIGELAGVVTQRAHKPVNTSLPCSYKDNTLAYGDENEVEDVAGASAQPTRSERGQTIA